MKKIQTLEWQQILQQTFRLYRANFDKFLQPITIQILLALLIVVIEAFDFPFHNAVLGIVSLIAFILNIWLIIVFLNISDSVIKNEKVSLEATYQKSLSRIPQFAAVFSLTLLITLAVFLVMYTLWAIFASLMIERLIDGDPLQYIRALENTLRYDPESISEFLNPGIVVLLILGALSVIPAVYIFVRYSLSMVRAAITKESEPVMKIIAENYAKTKNKFWKILSNYAIPMIIYSAFQSIIIIGIGSIITAGKYEMLELSGNIYYNILSIVIAGLFTPLTYLVIISTLNKLNEHTSIKQA